MRAGESLGWGQAEAGLWLSQFLKLNYAWIVLSAHSGMISHAKFPLFIIS